MAENNFPSPLPCIILKCENCLKEISYSESYVKAGLAKCTSRKCRNDAKHIAESIIPVLGYRFVGFTIISSRVVTSFICNNGHDASLYFESLRNGKICPKCTRTKNGLDRKRRPKKAPKIVRPNCQCILHGKAYGHSMKLCEHYNFKVMCPEQSSEWSSNNALLAHQVAPKCNSSFLFVCKNCHREFSQRVSERFGGSGCSYCYGNHKLAEEKSLAFKYPHLVSEWDPANELTPDKVFAGSDIKVGWICTKGHRWKTKVLSRTSGTSGCPVCNGNGLTAESGALEAFVRKSMIIHDHKYLYPGSYQGSKKKIEIICPIHGSFFQLPIDHRSGHGCTTCGTGKRITGPVKRLIQAFSDLGYECLAEVGFPGMKHINALAVDIFIPALNLVVEYDGKQHFVPIKSWGGLKSLIQIFKRDLAKDEYCVRKGISIMRIPFTCNEFLESLVPGIAGAASRTTIYASYEYYITRTQRKVGNVITNVSIVQIG